MPLNTWKKILRIMEIKNPWWTYRFDRVRLPNGNEGEYHYVHVIGSSMLVPVLADGRIALVKQYRYLLDRESIELPCGGVKEGSTYEETAAHELAEETGFKAGRLEYIGEFNPYNGVTDELCRVYLARDLVPAPAHHDETEEFEHLHLTISEIEELIRLGVIWDGMTLAAWSLVRHLLKA